MNEKYLTSREAFELFMMGYELEYFTYDAWWDLTLSTSISVFKKCDIWKLKD